MERKSGTELLLNFVMAVAVLVGVPYFSYMMGKASTMPCEGINQAGTIVKINQMIGAESREDSIDASGILPCTVMAADGTVVNAVLAAGQPICEGDKVWVEKVQAGDKITAIVARRPDNYSHDNRPFLRQTASGY